MPHHPSPKVAAIASIFQPQADARDEDTDMEERRVGNGRHSLPIFGGKGFSKHRAVLKRTNSQKDRFSSARKMWEKKDNLNTSNTSIASTTSSSGIIGINKSNICVNSYEATPRNCLIREGTDSSHPTEEVHEEDEINAKSDLEVGQEKDGSNVVDAATYKKTSNAGKQQDFRPVLAQDLSLKPSDLDESSHEISSSPPPLPSLPPPPVPGSPNSARSRPLTFGDRTDSQLTLLEYAELCESIPSFEYMKVEEEFDRLAEMTDLGQIDEMPDVTNVGLGEDKSTNIVNKVDGNQEGFDEHVNNEVIHVEYISEIDPLNSEPAMSLDSASLGTGYVDTSPFRMSTNKVLPSWAPSLPVEVRTNGECNMMMNEIAEGGDNEKNSNSQHEAQNKPIDKSVINSEDGNSSSLGSSLVGENVSSWLGTPGSCISDPSPKNHDQSSRYIPSNGESSDYVSGNSAELVSSSTESTVGASPQNEEEPKLHYLDDGNFWVEGAPIPLIEDLPGDSSLYHPPSRVKFSSLPVRIYSTFTDDEYDRKNDDIDPAAASAEYELERRVEKMDTYEVTLMKDEGGLGLSILGMGVGMDTGVEKLGIFIKTLTAGGVAEMDGRMKVNDQILSVDGSSLVGVTQEFAASVLRNTSGLVEFVVGRDREPGDSEVAQLIKQCVEADIEEIEDEDSLGIEDTCSESFIFAGVSNFDEQGEPCFTPLPEARKPELDTGTDEGKAWLENFSKFLHGDERSDGLENCASGKIPSFEDEVEGVDVGWTEDGDAIKFPLEDSVNSLIIVQPKDEIMDHSCCEHEKNYKNLLQKYNESQDTIGQLKRNLSIVTEQLVSRDQLYSTHMSRLKEVFSQLEKQLQEDDDGVSSCQTSFLFSLEPRGALRRKPFIPKDFMSLVDTSELPSFCLEQAVPPTPVLDSTLARDKVLLVHRGTLARRRARARGKYIHNDSNVGNDSIATATIEKVDENSSEFEKETTTECRGMASAFQDELMKKLLHTSTFGQSEISGASPTTRACSLPTSPTMSPYSSSSSLHSVPGSEEGPVHFKREKRRLSGINLWEKARRRLSSR